MLLVFSAMAGATNRLFELAPGGENTESKCLELLSMHAGLAAGLGIEASGLLDEFAQRLERSLLACAERDTPGNRALLVSLGEWISTKLAQLYLSAAMPCDWVDARQALRVVEEEFPDSNRAWLSARCDAGVDAELQASWGVKSNVLVTQGYVAGKGDGGTALLGRGGSDTSAALLASRLGAREVEIWTDVPGLFSSDPARSPEALLIRKLDYVEALEMAASGARVVHPRCIRVAADAGIALQVRDLKRPEHEGTRINGGRNALDVPAVGVKAVICQRGMLVMLLENLDTRQQVGFLAWVFGVISALGVSVDLVATSETTTTVAINDVDNHIDQPLLDMLSERLSARCRLRLFPQACCVNLVGRGVRTALGQFGHVGALIEEQPLLMMSQSANDMCLSLLVYPEHADRLVDALHRQLVSNGSAQRWPDVYGQSWRALSGAGNE